LIGNEFVCKDRKGITVACSRECWAKHVIVHAEMNGQQGVVKAVVESPTSEYQDAHHIDTRNYYKRLVLKNWGNTLVKVSVRYGSQMGKERGRVKTAYATDKVKKGEVWLWGQKLPD
jgi:hypothetical protein